MYSSKSLSIEITGTATELEVAVRENNDKEVKRLLRTLKYHTKELSKTIRKEKELRI